MHDRWENRDGRWFKVTVLPEAKPPRGRSKRTRYKMEHVGKAGNLEPKKLSAAPPPARTKFPFMAKINGREVQIFER